MADVESIPDWNTKQVVNWFQGLDESLQAYWPNLEEACITGAQLLALNYEDLNNLGIFPTGHQELVLESTELLKQLCFNLDNENLQSHALNLNCRCRALRSTISSHRRDIDGPATALQRGSPIPLLRMSADVLEHCKMLVMWLDRPPFVNRPEIKSSRAIIVKLGYELSTTIQQSVFTCVIEDAALAICSEMEDVTNQIIISNDAMTIQPASLEVVHLVNRDPAASLGLFIKTTFEGYHVITGTKEGSISSKIRRIGSGDEVVAVGGQIVVGWQLTKLVEALKATLKDFSIVLKKRPHFSQSHTVSTPVQRRHRPERIITVPPPISPISKVVNSRNNSVSDVPDGVDATAKKREEAEAAPAQRSGKRRLKKRKAKSSDNILREAQLASKLKSTENSTGRPSDKRNSVDSYSSHNSSLNLSSNEGVPSQSGIKSSKGKVRHKSLENFIKPFTKSVSSPLKDDNSDKIHNVAQKRSKSQGQLHDASKPGKSKFHDEGKPVVIETPPSPLDLLIIPPPPQAPYTPRRESVVKAVDTNSDAANGSPAAKTSESPNSILDIEHHRRFTVIGSESLDEKWYQSVLSEVNSSKAKRARQASGKTALQSLDEAKNSSDSVFLNSKSSVKDDSVPKFRPRKPPRSRPVSMPPNYYSPIKLRQLREAHAAKALKRNQSPTLTTIEDEAGSYHQSPKISPLAHIDDQGVKKLAPLICNAESPDSSVTKRYKDPAKNSPQRHSWYNGATNYNINNNNNFERSSSSVEREKVPPKPPPRSSSVSQLTNQIVPESPFKQLNKSSNYISSDDKKKVMEESHRLKAPNAQNRPRSTGGDPKQYIGLLKINPNPSIVTDKTPPAKPARRNRSQTEITPTALARAEITDELTKYYMRRKNSGTPSGESNKLAPSPTKTSPEKHPDVFSPPTMSKQEPLIPPVAKPRSKKTSLPTPASDITSSSPVPPSTPPKPRRKSEEKPRKQTDKSRLTETHMVSSPNLAAGLSFRDTDSGKERSHSASTPTSSKSLSMRSSNSPKDRRKSEGIFKKQRESSPGISDSDAAPVFAQQRRTDTRTARLRSSPSSRGSYVAAIDVGYALENVRRNSNLESGKDKTPQDSENYRYKTIGGVQVKLRKTGKKKGSIGDLKNSQSSPDMRSQRRVSCRDLGKGECDGWLWRKKSNSTSPLSSKWTKRWVVLKEGAVYCYRTPEDDKAESYIGLPGYKITPAPECKKAFAFRAVHPKRKTFFFASDRQMDMSRWMNKMGLAAIEYVFSEVPAAYDTGSIDSSPEKSVNGKKEYYSESENEDSGLNSDEIGSPSSSPEKNAKPQGAGTEVPRPTKRTGRNICATQEVLNKSARYPANKARKPKSTDNQAGSLQTVESTSKTSAELQKDSNRNRSKSEAALSSKDAKTSNRRNTEVLSASAATAVESEEAVSESTSPSTRIKPAVTADNRKHKKGEARRKQYFDMGPLSHSLESLNSSKSGGETELYLAKSEEELRHLKITAAKKAEEVAKREASKSPTSSSSSTQSLGNGNSEADRPSLYVKKATKNKSGKNTSGVPARIHANLEQDESPVNEQPGLKLSRRDVAGRPRLKLDEGRESEPTTKAQKAQTESSIDDLCRALQHAEVDIHGMNRRTTLRRKMTVLSRDPRRNEFLLKKRSLQRQLKALQGELEYYNKLLEQPHITSENLHAWINQHPSLLADLGTIRRLSKIKRKPVTDLAFKEAEDKVKSADSPGNTPTSSAIEENSHAETPTEATIENDETNRSISEPVSLTGSSHTPGSADEPTQSQGSSDEILDTEQGSTKDPPLSPEAKAFSRSRPRSCAFSSNDLSPIKSTLTSPERKPYLETDL